MDQISNAQKRYQQKNIEYRSDNNTGCDSKSSIKNNCLIDVKLFFLSEYVYALPEYMGTKGTFDPAYVRSLFFRTNHRNQPLRFQTHFYNDLILFSLFIIFFRC